MRIRQSKKNDNWCKDWPGDIITGFTLVEVVVAIALLGTTTIAVFCAMRSCSTASYHSRMLTKSVLLAESLLVEARLDENAVFQTKQGQEDVFKWRVKIAPTSVEDLGAIHVLVEWWEQQRHQQYELFSLVQMKSFTQKN